MPYTVRKQKCKQSSGKKGSHVLSYTDKKGKKHRACHTSEKGARGQIAAIEAESVERNEKMKISIQELRQIIKEEILREAYVSSLDQVLGQENVNSYLRMMNDPRNIKNIANKIKYSLQTNIPAPNLMMNFRELESLNLQDPELDTKEIKDILIKLLTSSNPEAERELSASEEEEKIKKYVAGYKSPLQGSRNFAALGKKESLQKLKNLIRNLILTEINASIQK